MDYGLPIMISLCLAKKLFLEICEKDLFMIATCFEPPDIALYYYVLCNNNFLLAFLFFFMYTLANTEQCFGQHPEHFFV
jgi:hypothetical protein